MWKEPIKTDTVRANKVRKPAYLRILPNCVKTCHFRDHWSF